MYWHCDIFDKVMYEEFRKNHLQSGFHKRLVTSIIRKYIFSNPKTNKDDNINRKHLISHYRNYEKNLVILSMKLLILPNQYKNIRRQHPCHRNQQCINNASFFSQINIFKEQLFSQTLELRLSFVSRFENITFDHYITKTKSMLEWKLLAMLDKNTKIVHSFDYKHYNHPLFREFFDDYLDRCH